MDEWTYKELVGLQQQIDYIYQRLTEKGIIEKSPKEGKKQ